MRDLIARTADKVLYFLGYFPLVIHQRIQDRRAERVRARRLRRAHPEGTRGDRS